MRKLTITIQAAGGSVAATVFIVVYKYVVLLYKAVCGLAAADRRLLPLYCYWFMFM